MHFLKLFDADFGVNGRGVFALIQPPVLKPFGRASSSERQRKRSPKLTTEKHAEQHIDRNSLY